jgi:hypothetical protein
MRDFRMGETDSLLLLQHWVYYYYYVLLKNVQAKICIVGLLVRSKNLLLAVELVEPVLILIV